ncbi:class I SAM-dependent methyltransferase [Xenorhabdus sp. PB30.3]|uniref:class I SAM-dependent methyltransferase n=1 Tax=Xenorhabdus sp. PB30.3 TaxID=2788941 RepID=UPI001E3C050F|nr:class I SAM-dependent methyltransferase [Xenorhabdus sp. PB30.3]MCC8379331.1 class I SAM-dependent methyltransferase [Xenorhabdus sp. PB30.3]
MTDFLTANQIAWDRQAEEQHPWSVPVSSETVSQAKKGEWQVHLTPKALPKEWLGDISQKRILCLASAGGQQAPILAAAGAEVTVFDLSIKQLEQDRIVAERDELRIETVQGDMRDLSIFADETFDFIFHPISNLYIPDVNPVWQECHRVLKRKGKLLASFFNPVVFVGERNQEHMQQGIIKPLYKMPFSEMDILTPEQITDKNQKQEAFVFGHSLTDLIGGQLRVGFRLIDFYEDWQPYPRFVIDQYLPTFMATRSIKD